MYPSETVELDTVLEAIRNERDRQYAKFGEDNPLSIGPDAVRVPVVGEEFGEVCREVIESELRLVELGSPQGDPHLFKELVQLAAVATAWAEQVYIRTPSVLLD